MAVIVVLGWIVRADASSDGRMDPRRAQSGTAALATIRVGKNHDLKKIEKIRFFDLNHIFFI